jgi:hypothetical protein
MFHVGPQSYAELLELYSEAAIYHFYLGHCNINKPFLSVLRPEKTPSMILSVRGDAILWFDNGKVESAIPGHRAIHLVMLLFSLSYYSALDKIYLDISTNEHIDLPTIYKSDPITKQIVYKLKRPKFIDDYFMQYEITSHTLDLYNVGYCTEFRFNNKLWHKSTEEDFMILYLFNASEHVWQIYRPYAENRETPNKLKKHRPFNMDDVLMGYSQLPDYCPIIGITTSYKDVMTNVECGIPSICRSGEKNIIKPFQIETLRQRCDKIVYFGDNDETGLAIQEEYRRLYNIETWSPPEYKDQSDFVFHNSKLKLINLFKQKNYV